jgi:hypothetical protein
MKDNDITIKEEYRDRCFTTLCIDGFSVEEMNEILAKRETALGEIMYNHGMGGTFQCWKCGYGIYSISHVGGHLFVQIGNSCD